MTDYTKRAKRDALRQEFSTIASAQYGDSDVIALLDACDTLEARAEALAHRPDCVAGEGTTHWYRCEERIAVLEKALRDIARDFGPYYPQILGAVKEALEAKS